MKKLTNAEMIDQAAQTLLLVGSELVPMRTDYRSEDIVDQIVYMLTVFKTIPFDADDARPLAETKARMVHYLEEARR